MTNYQPVNLAYSCFEPATQADPNLSPILFLHGLTACKEHWGLIPQVVADSTKRKVYTLDSRNHGDSEWSDCFNFDINVVDLFNFMDNTGIKKAIIIGHSMGGITAIKAALQKPERVERLVAEDMSVRRINPAHLLMVLAYVSALRKAIESAPSDVDEDTAKSYIINFLLAHLPPSLVDLAAPEKKDPEQLKKLLMLRRGPDGRYQFKANIAVIEKALLNVEKLSQDIEGVFQGPAHFIYGKASPFLVGADEYTIKQYFPSATMTGIEDAGHSIHNDKPLEFTDALLKCLS